MAWQVLLYSAFEFIATLYEQRVNGLCRDAQRCIQGYLRGYGFLGSLLQSGGGNCGADMALEAYCG